LALTRRAAVTPAGGVRGAARDHVPEGERTGLRAHDVEGGRLGDQRRVEGAVALERGERAEAAVLLGGDALEDDSRPAGAAQGGQRVQRGDDGALHVDRAAAVQAAVLEHARPRSVPPRRGAGPDDVDVSVQAQPARRLAGQRDRQAPQLVARRLLARMARVGAQPRQVVLVEVRLEAEAGRQVGEHLERRPLLAGDAGDPDQ
jgi:hypothetical protein